MALPKGADREEDSNDHAREAEQIELTRFGLQQQPNQSSSRALEVNREPLVAVSIDLHVGDERRSLGVARGVKGQIVERGLQSKELSVDAVRCVHRPAHPRENRVRHPIGPSKRVQRPRSIMRLPCAVDDGQRRQAR